MKKSFTLTFISIMFFSFSFGFVFQNSTDSKMNIGFDDSTIKIGNQLWALNNLDVENFRNGESIPQAKTQNEWKEFAESKKPCWCYPEYDETNKELGKIYNYHAFQNEGGLIPAGWHLPTEEEWMSMINELGGLEKAGKKMKSKTGWNEERNGNNKSGFNAFPSGDCGFIGTCSSIGSAVCYWISTTAENQSVKEVCLSSYDDLVEIEDANPGNGKFIRCIKD